MPLAPAAKDRVITAMMPIQADFPNKSQFDQIVQQIEATNPAAAHYMKGFEKRMTNAIKAIMTGMEEKNKCLHILLSAYEERDRMYMELQAQLEQFKYEMEWGPDVILSPDEQIRDLVGFMLQKVEREVRMEKQDNNEDSKIAINESQHND